jgi:hypothetical protein
MKTRLKYENEINQILKQRHESKGYVFEEPIKLKKLNEQELMYFYRLVKFDLS